MQGAISRKLACTYDLQILDLAGLTPVRNLIEVFSSGYSEHPVPCLFWV